MLLDQVVVSVRSGFQVACALPLLPGVVERLGCALIVRELGAGAAVGFSGLGVLALLRELLTCLED